MATQSGGGGFLEYGLPVLGNIAGSVGQYLAGGADRKFKKQSRKRVGELDQEISEGISTNDLATIAPLMSKVLSRSLTQAFSKSAGKFGSNSGLAQGTAITEGINSVAPAVASAGTRRIFSNFDAKRGLFNAYAGLAA